MAVQSRSGLIFAVLALLLPLAVYLLWTPLDYSGDDLQQSVVIHKSTYGGEFYHPAGGLLYEPGLLQAPPELAPLPIQPRYLFEYPTSILVAQLWKAAGWEGTVITPVQTFRAGVGALGILFMFLALRNLLNAPLIALIGSFGLAFTAAYWTYSTHVDQSINMMLFISLAFYLLVRQRTHPPSLRSKFLIVLVMAGASFYNFTAVFTTMAIGLGLAFMPPGLTLLQRVREFIVYCVLYGIIIVIIMAISISLLASPAALADPQFWQGVLFAGKPEYGIAIVNDTIRAILGLAKSQVSFPGVQGSLQDYWDSTGQREKILIGAYFGVVLLLLASPFVLLVIRRRHLPANHGWLWITLGAMLLLHSAFNWFWDPGFIKYWLIPLFCIWIVIAFALNHAKQTLPRLYRPALAVSVIVLAATFAVNFVTEFYPDSQPSLNPWAGIANTLKESPENALFISDAHPLDFYIVYFTRRNILSRSLIEYDQGGIEADVVELINQHIDEHRAHNGDVYLYSGSNIETLATQLGFSMEQLEPAWEFPQVAFYKVNFDSST